MTIIYQRPHRTSRPKLQLDVSPMFWGGALVVGAMLVAVLYCLIMHQIPV